MTNKTSDDKRNGRLREIIYKALTDHAGEMKLSVGRKITEDIVSALNKKLEGLF